MGGGGGIHFRMGGAPGGGFILGPSHSIAKNTQYDNFLAMLDEFVSRRDKYC